MRIHYLLLAVLTLLAPGCIHQQPLLLAEMDSVVRLNERAAEHLATVILANGDAHTARFLQVAADSTSWLVPESEAVTNVATSEIVAVRFVSRGRGALEGLGLGFVAGGLIGAVVGLLDGDDPSCEKWCFFRMTAQEKAMAAGVGLGLVGGVIGLPVGAATGSRDVYRLERPVTPGVGSDRRDEHLRTHGERVRTSPTARGE